MCNNPSTICVRIVVNEKLCRKKERKKSSAELGREKNTTSVYPHFCVTILVRLTHNSFQSTGNFMLHELVHEEISLKAKSGINQFKVDLTVICSIDLCKIVSLLPI